MLKKSNKALIDQQVRKYLQPVLGVNWVCKLCDSLELTPSEPRKNKNKILLSIQSWLFNRDRDPYFMVYKIIPTQLGGFRSPIYPNQPVFFIAQVIVTTRIITFLGSGIPS